jgi:uncharacterized protein (TIGR03643 family)
MTSARHDTLNDEDTSRIIEMAWQDDTPFEAIERQFSLDESAVIALMRATLKAGSFRLWRKRMRGRVRKHETKQQSARQRHEPGPTWRSHPDASQADDFPSPELCFTAAALR